MKDKVYIIAELSANHNNNLDLALQTLDSMSESGADAIKVQTYTADSLTLNVNNKFFGPRDSGIWKGRTPFDVFSEGAMPYDWHSILQERATSLGLDFFSSPFDKEAVDLLESLDVPAYKIASFEIRDIPLIKYVASKGKPIIISTGIASKEDIALALDTCRSVGNEDITILKCTSAYPSPFDEINLKMIPQIKSDFSVKVGLSDHTLGHAVALGAVALGATVVEKHFILNRELGGVDSSFSMEPSEFKTMVEQIRILEKAMGKVSYELTDKAKDSSLRGRSIFISEDVKKNTIISEENIRVVRPGYGLHPKYYNEVLGKLYKKDIEKGTPLSWGLIDDLRH